MNSEPYFLYEVVYNETLGCCKTFPINLVMNNLQAIAKAYDKLLLFFLALDQIFIKKREIGLDE